MERLQLHQSGLALFGRCGEAFRRRYVVGETHPPREYLIVGRGADRAIEHDLRNKIKTGKLLSAATIEQIAVDVVERDFMGDVDLNGEYVSKGTAREYAMRRAIDMSLFSHRNLTPTIHHPKAVQVPWSIRLDGILAQRGLPGMKIDFVGTPDVHEWLFQFSDDEPSGIAIRDVKTSRRSPSEDACDSRHWIQLTSYALGMKVMENRWPDRVQVDYLVQLKKGIEHKSVMGLRTDYDAAGVFNRLENLAWHMKAGVYAPAPRDHWMCSHKWCPFYDSCPYVKNAHTIELRVPEPKLFQLDTTERKSIHATAAPTNGTSQSAADEDCIDPPDDATVAGKPYLVTRGPELDPTDD